jgi:hypothetical protein
MSYMFNGATAFNQGISSWDISGIGGSNTMTDMFIGSAWSEANYNEALDSWSGATIPDNVVFGTDAQYLNYDVGAAHDYLVNTRGWTITDGGPRYRTLIGDASNELDGDTGLLTGD